MKKNYASHQLAKEAGWYSCRHSDSQAHMNTRDAREERGVQKVASALSRQEDRDARGDEGQLARLDIMFGVGKGAVKERAKLAKRIEDRKAAEQAAKEEAKKAAEKAKKEKKAKK